VCSIIVPPWKTDPQVPGRHDTANAPTTHGEIAKSYERRAKPNSKIKKLRIRLTITKMQVKNFDLELLSLHPNRGHGAAELALGNSL